MVARARRRRARRRATIRMSLIAMRPERQRAPGAQHCRRRERPSARGDALARGVMEQIETVFESFAADQRPRSAGAQRRRSTTSAWIGRSTVTSTSRACHASSSITYDRHRRRSVRAHRAGRAISRLLAEIHPAAPRSSYARRTPSHSASATRRRRAARCGRACFGTNAATDRRTSPVPKSSSQRVSPSASRRFSRSGWPCPPPEWP